MSSTDMPCCMQAHQATCCCQPVRKPAAAAGVQHRQPSSAAEWGAQPIDNAVCTSAVPAKRVRHSAAPPMPPATCMRAHAVMCVLHVCLIAGCSCLPLAVSAAGRAARPSSAPCACDCGLAPAHHDGHHSKQQQPQLPADQGLASSRCNGPHPCT